MRKVRLPTEVYVAIGLHAAKYFHHSVVGYIIGTEGEGHVVTVTDIIPIGHSVPAGPILEIAGEITEKSFKAPKKILGIYYATEFTSNHSTVPSFVEAIANSLHTILGDCILLHIKNNAFRDETKLYLDICSSHNGQIKCETIDNIATANNIFTQALTKDYQQALYDFEDHMNQEGKVDFRNTALFELLKKLH